MIKIIDGQWPIDTFACSLASIGVICCLQGEEWKTAKKSKKERDQTIDWFPFFYFDWGYKSMNSSLCIYICWRMVETVRSFVRCSRYYRTNDHLTICRIWWLCFGAPDYPFIIESERFYFELYSIQESKGNYNPFNGCVLQNDIKNLLYVKLNKVAHINGAHVRSWK